MQNFNDPFQEESLDLKKIIKKYLHLWPWFVVSILIAFGAATLLNIYNERIYQNEITLLINEDQSLLNLEAQISSNPLFASNAHIQNQIGVLTSRTLMYSTLKVLDFGTEYYKIKPFGNEEFYPNKIFTIEIDSLHPQAVNVPLKVSRGHNGKWAIAGQWGNALLYSFAEEDFCGEIGEISTSTEVLAGQWVETPYFRFRIVENENWLSETSDEFVVVFRDIFSQIAQFQTLNVVGNRNSTLLKVSIQGRSRKKNEVFLNTYAHRYLKRDLDKKSRRAQKTIDFIKEQLGGVSQLLQHSEISLEDFRSTEQILNIDYQSQKTVEQMEQLQHEKAQLIVKEKYYEYLTSYLERIQEDDSELLAPSSLGVDDPLLSGLITQLMQHYTERSELQINSKKDNPFLTNVESRIKNTKNTIKESLNNIKHANRISISNLDDRIEKVSRIISMIPESEKNLFKIERQFQLHNTLYTLLQSKKSEIEITRAGLMPVHEIIDAAIASEGVLVSPQKKRTYYIAGLAGFLIPLLLISFLDFFNDKVRSNEDIEKMQLFPILGYITRNPEKSDPVISFGKNSIQAESFRTVRTNAQFVVPANDKPVIMVTSTLFGEGKTFVSFNLASSYASMKKKTVLFSFDMRKPKLSDYLQQVQKNGLSNYLSSNIKAEDVILKSQIDNLDIAFSGPIPPNPAELLSSPRVNELFEYAKKHYDMIIVDTPPAGMVADALLLVPHVNVIMYLVRHNRTPYKYLLQTLKNLKEKEIKNINLVLNDTPSPSRFSQYNTYGLQYGYYEKY